MGTFDEALHPRAQDGKFGAGSGGPRKAAPRKPKAGSGQVPPPGQVAAPSAQPKPAGPRVPAAKAKVAARTAAAKAKAATVLATAKDKAKALLAKAKAAVPASKPGKPVTAAAKARVAAARVKAKERAVAIVAKAKGRAKALVAKAKGVPRVVKPKTPAAAAKTAPAPAAKAVDPRAAHEAAAIDSIRKAHESHAASVAASRDAKESATDTDFAGARGHLATAEKHHADMLGHLAAAQASADAHGGAALKDRVKQGAELGDRDRDATGFRTLQEHTERGISSAKAAIRFGEEDQQTTHSAKAAPEGQALKAGEYRAMSEAFPKMLSNEQRVAVMNYSDHSDRILNPMLRQTAGKPDVAAKLYEGDGVPAGVHKERLAKRRERVDAAGDTDMTVGTEMTHLDAAIAGHKFDRDTLAYRVLSDKGGKLMGGLQVGSTFQDHGYVSTTANKGLLNKFYDGDHADRVDVHVTIGKGKAGAPMAKLSSFGAEKEILLPRGSKFCVTKIVPGTATQAKQVHMETI